MEYVFEPLLGLVLAGFGKDIQVHFLWIQERVGNGDIILKKVWGGENPADLLTKILDGPTLNRCLRTFGVKYMEGRADLAPAVADSSCAVSCIVPTARW